MTLRNKTIALAAGFLLILLGVRPSPAPTVMADSAGNLLTPLLFAWTNILAGSNIFISGPASGKITISGTVEVFSASNALYSIETTRNAAVSNASIAEIVTASNNVYTTETTRNAAVSNALITYVNTADVAISNTIAGKVDESAGVATNLSVYGATVTSNLTYNLTTIAGAGNGNTNYTLHATASDMYLGSSNVNIVAVMQTLSGSARYWTASITNDSANTWGISFSSVTNRWRFSGTYGTNAPSVLTNGTLLYIAGRSEGTNTLIGYTYYAPAK